MTDTDKIKELRKLIRLFTRKIGFFEKSEASCCGITLGQCHALLEIKSNQEISLNELAELLNLDKSTMSRTINNLVENNWVERETCPEDRRYLQLKLTDKGDAMLREIEESMDRYFSKIYNAIPLGKREQVLESLKLLLEAMDDYKCC
jgi:DNA-binding MarR family transcriptional regulator